MLEGNGRRATDLAWAALAGLAAFVFWAAFGALLTNPVVLGDEWGFYLNGVVFDRLPTLWRASAIEAPVGVFGFPWLIHLCDSLGLPPATAIKLVNAGAIGAAAVVLALSTRRRADDAPARGLALAVGFGAGGTYAAYVMPEAAYLLAFTLAVGAFWRGERALGAVAKAQAWALAGSACGLATLLKPHGLALLLTALTIPVAWACFTRRQGLAAAAIWTAALTAGFILSFALGSAITRPPHMPLTLDIFGANYRAQLGGSAGGGLARAIRAAGLAGGYLCAIGTLLAPSIMQLVVALRFARREPGRAAPATLFLLVLLPILAFAVANVVAGEPDRTHLRYLSFAFPAIVVEGWRCGDPKDGNRPWRRATAAVWLACAAVFAWRLPHLRPLPVDAPELFFAYSSGEFGAFGLGRAAVWVMLAVVASGAAALAFTRWSWLSIQLAVLAPLVAVSVFNVGVATRGWAAESEAPRALGRLAAAQCGPADDDIAVIATPESMGWVFNATWPLRRATPLVLAPDSQVRGRLLALPPGRCILSSASVDSPNLQRLSPSAPLVLYRTR